MNALTNKTSSQAFFLRVLKVIIQLRDAALHAMKKSKLASEAVAKKAKEAEAAAAAATASAAAATSPTTESSMEVSEAAGTEAAAESPPDGATSAEANAVAKEPSLPSLSDELLLNTLWETLSACLRDLADTPDHHAVLVLQVTFIYYVSTFRERWVQKHLLLLNFSTFLLTLGERGVRK